MGMSTHAIGFCPPDEEWNKLKDVYNACKAAGLPIPDKVESVFDGNNPNDMPGMEVDLGDAENEWSDEYRSGIVVDLSKLPPHVKFIRFYNSW